MHRIPLPLLLAASLAAVSPAGALSLGAVPLHDGAACASVATTWSESRTFDLTRLGSRVVLAGDEAGQAPFRLAGTMRLTLARADGTAVSALLASPARGCDATPAPHGPADISGLFGGIEVLQATVTFGPSPCACGETGAVFGASPLWLVGQGGPGPGVVSLTG